MTRYIHTEDTLPTVHTGKRGRPATDWAAVIENSQASRLVVRKNSTSSANSAAGKVRLFIKKNRMQNVKVLVEGTDVIITKE